MESVTTLHGLITGQGAVRGSALAIAAPGRLPLSYARLAEEVERLAAPLRAAGAGRDNRIVAVMPNGPEMAVLFFAATSVATLAPLNPALTERELGPELQRLQPAVVVVPGGAAGAARAASAALGIPCLEVRTEPQAEAGVFMLAPATQLTRARAVPSCGEDDAPAGSDDDALILSTSGTTSRPKLVPLTHANVLAAAAATCAAYRLGVGDRRLNIMPLFHVQGLVGTVAACALAGTSVMCVPNFDPEKSLKMVESFRPTWVSASPTMYIQLLERLRSHGAADLSSLRFVRVGSAALPGQLRAALENRLGIPVVESYGMTEAHQIASTPLPPGHRKPGTVGLPTGSDVIVVDERGRRCRPGETGEILIRGTNVMRGYLDDPAANAAAFAGGWLRTGDLGWLDEDGYLAVCGRLKDLINRGGEKIAPQEVDDALLGHPAVMEAAAFPLAHPVLQEEVAAAVVPRDGLVTESELRQYLSKRLAPFKVPRRIMLVDEIPKSRAGKVQRRALAEVLAPSAAPTDAAAEAREGVKAMESWSPIEIALAALWRAVLKAPDLGRNDDFFLLGGDSLSGVELLTRVEEVFGVEISALSMYDEASTVATMAALIERRRGGVSAGSGSMPDGS